MSILKMTVNKHSSRQTAHSHHPLKFEDNLYIKFIRKAMGLTMKLLQVGIGLFSVSVILLWLSIFLHVTVLNKWIPATDHEWPVFLQFSDCNGKPGICSNPVGVVTLDAKSQERLSPSAMSSDSYNNENWKKNKYQQHRSEYSEDCGKKGCSNVESVNVFTRGQTYSARILLEVPDSPGNRELGMFQISLSLHDKDDGLITVIRRSARLPYRPLMHKVLFDIMKLPFILFEMGHTATSNLNLPMLESFVEDSTKPIHHMKVQIFSRQLEWDSCRVQFETELTGLRYFLGNHPVISFIFSVSVNVFAFLFLAGLMLHFYKKSDKYNFRNFLKSLQQTFEIKQNTEEIVNESKNELLTETDIPVPVEDVENIFDEIKKEFDELNDNENKIKDCELKNISGDIFKTEQKKNTIPDYMNEPLKTSSLDISPSGTENCAENISALEKDLLAFAPPEEYKDLLAFSLNDGESSMTRRAVYKEGLNERELSPSYSDVSHKSDDSYIVVKTGENTPEESAM